MICPECREAAAIITGPCPPDPDRAVELHLLYCRGGTWCDCQHKPVRPSRPAQAAPTLVE